MATDTSGQQAVDFVWGNFPMQPDDDRTGTATQISTGDVAYDKGWGATTLVNSVALTKTAISKTLNNGITQSVENNHSVALNNWNKYPDYDPVAPYLDTVDQAAVPNVVGLDESAAEAALVAAGFVKGAVTTADNDAGATSENDGLVKTQTPAAAAIKNLGDAVALVKYAYTAP